MCTSFTTKHMILIYNARLVLVLSVDIRKNLGNARFLSFLVLVCPNRDIIHVMVKVWGIA